MIKEQLNINITEKDIITDPILQSHLFLFNLIESDLQWEYFDLKK